MSISAEQEISRLLAATGAAHGIYETTELGGVYDQHWATWYASYLVAHGLGELLKQPIAVDVLAIALAEYDAAYRREHPPQEWPDYYASLLIAHTTAMRGNL